MPIITKKIADLMKKLDKLIEDTQRDVGAIIAAGKEIKDSLPQKEPDDKQET